MDITMALEPLSIDDLGYFPASLLLEVIWSLNQIFVIHDPAHTFACILAMES